jgi:NAD(P)-dependent dehydrogenase (short-subunit alcohol dehydrogenase family)
MIHYGKNRDCDRGSRGIGRQICSKLAEYGVNIVINYAGNDKEAELTRDLCTDEESACRAGQGRCQ